MYMCTDGVQIVYRILFLKYTRKCVDRCATGGAFIVDISCSNVNGSL